MTYAQRLEYEQHLHRKYFEPFDRLLEKKAQYYLDQAEKGSENKWLLEEIETMERFREYIVILETLMQQSADEQYRTALYAEYLKNLLKSTARYASERNREFKRLQEQCQQP